MAPEGVPQLAGRRRSRWPALAAVALVVAMPVAVWWAVGDVSAPEATAIPDPDYQIHPFDIAPTTERVVGVGAVVLVAVSVGALVTALWSGRMHRLWWPVLLQLSLAGAVCGAGWRVLTAAVIGANIGAGLVILFGGPLVLLMLVTALGRTVELLGHDPWLEY